MSRAVSRVVVVLGAFVCLTAAVTSAHQATTTTETKKFEVIAVDGNQLVVKLPEGTKELTVPDDFRFTVNGQQLSVQRVEARHVGNGNHHHEDRDHARHRHRSEERDRDAGDRVEHHRAHRRGIQDVHPRRRGQARRQDHAPWQACGGVRVPLRRQAVGDHHHHDATEGRVGEGSAGHPRE